MKNAKQLPSVAIRLAALMDRERIEGLPRNYELLYDVYSGTNPELTKEYLALGEIKTQKALDELGRKYLPHQHEEGVLAKANDAMQSQMSSFLQLIQDELTSLAEFEKVIDETNRAITSPNGIDTASIVKSIDKLSKATVQQFKNNKNIGEAAQAQNAAVHSLKSEMDAIEAMKWTDQVTGLANRRSFNKTMAGVFANPDRPTPCGLAFAEFDDYRNFSANGEYPFTNKYLRDIAGLFRAANTSNQFISYLDKGRFAIILNTVEIDHFVSFIEGLRNTLKAKKPIVTRRNSKNAPVTLSFGLALASNAASAGELIGHAEKALSDAFAAGGDRVMIHAVGEAVDTEKNWRMYERG